MSFSYLEFIRNFPQNLISMIGTSLNFKNSVTDS